jgi:hypothetical protein
MLEEPREIWLRALSFPARAGALAAPSGHRSPLRDLSPRSNPMRVQLVIVQRESAAASGEIQHRCADQLTADVRPGVLGPRSDACSLSQYVVAAIGHLAQLLDGFVEAAAFGGVAMRALESS